MDEYPFMISTQPNHSQLSPTVKAALLPSTNSSLNEQSFGNTVKMAYSYNRFLKAVSFSISQKTFLK